VSWALVVAARGGNRSRAAREVVDALAARGLRVGGFTQRTVDHEDGSKEFELVPARAGAAVPLARAEKRAAAVEGGGCSVVFDPAAFEVARRWIEVDAPVSDVVVLDGIGKLELAGEGHRAAVTRALAAAPLVVLAIRDDQLVYAVEALGLDEPVAAYTDGDGPRALAAFVAELAAAAPAPAGQARS
jgi:nucleoside-triphosphatase THEP1